MTPRRRKVVTTRTDEVELLQPDGAQTCYRVVATGLTAGLETGTGPEVVEGVVATMRDVSLQKTMQRSHAEFVSSASHEMKTPLAGIKAYVELLADGDAEDEEQREEFLEVINGQADRLQRLIDNLLNLARIEAGVVQVSKQPPIAQRDPAREALRVVQPAAEAKQIQLVEHLSPMYLGVLVDRDMLLQAAINLLSNAVKYTPNGGRVTLRSRMLGRRDPVRSRGHRRRPASAKIAGAYSKSSIAWKATRRWRRARAWVCRWPSTSSKTFTAAG